MTTDPMMRLERFIKVIVTMISLVGLTFIGLRVMANRASLHLPNPKQECEALGRTYDAQRAQCLPR